MDNTTDKSIDIDRRGFMALLGAGGAFGVLGGEAEIVGFLRKI
jgi:hypothetical protein